VTMPNSFASAAFEDAPSQQQIARTLVSNLPCKKNGNDGWQEAYF